MNIKEWAKKQKSSAERKVKRRDNARFIAKMDGKKIAASRQYLEKQCDHLCHLLVARRDLREVGNVCRICGCRPPTVPYHLISRKYKSVRWYLPNIVHACSPCNWGEKQNRGLPGDFRNKAITLFGESFVLDLEDKARGPGKWSTADLILLRDKLKREVENPDPGIYFGGEI